MTTVDGKRTLLTRPHLHDLRKQPKARERELRDALLEQATQTETHAAFFMSAAGTNIGVLLIIVAIVMSLWVFTSALPGW